MSKIGARHSLHPLSRALATSSITHKGSAPVFSHIEEVPGAGVCSKAGMTTYRLGKRSWACPDQPSIPQDDVTEAVLSQDGLEIATYTFEEAFRDGAKEAVNRLEHTGLEVMLVSGDRPGPVAKAARGLGIGQYRAGFAPADKVTCISEFARQGEKVLMVGDGINDAPALAAAHVSIAPSSAADVGRQAADMVFVREGLEAVPEALTVARRADALVRQNIVFSLLYNAIAIPFAVLGLVTPLAAALAMSTSSIVVVLNAVRLGHTARAARPDQVAGIATLGDA